MNDKYRKVLYLLTVAFIAGTVILHAQSSEIGKLVPGQIINHDIREDETRRYGVGLARDQFVMFKASADGADIALKLTSSDGTTVATMDSWDSSSPEALSFIASDSGAFLLEIKSLSGNGAYSITLTQPRNATAADKLVVAIDKIYVEGLSAAGTAAKEAFIERMEREVQQADKTNDAELVRFAIRRQLDLYESALSADPLFADAMSVFLKADAKAFEDARGKFKTAADHYKAAGKPYYVALSLAFAALCERRLGNNAISATYYLDSLPTFRRYHDDKWVATITRELGSYYDLIGQKSKSLEYYGQALEVFNITNDKESQVITLQNIGVVLNSLGERKKALAHFEKALTIAGLIDNKQLKANAMTAIGSVYAILGEYSNALRFYNESLSLSRAATDKHGEAATLSHIGAVHFSLGEMKKAGESFEQAIVLDREVGDKSLEAGALGTLGWIKQRAGNTKEAMDNLTRALSLYVQVDDLQGRAAVLRDIGGLYLTREDLEQALRYLNDALTIQRTLGNRPAEAETLSYLMIAWKKIGSPRTAAFFGKQSINDHQQLRMNIAEMDRSIQQEYLGKVQGAYRYLADILISDGRIAEAEEVLRMLKEEESFSYLRRDDAVAKGLLQTAALTETEKAALARYNDLADRITAIGKELGELDLLRKQYQQGQFSEQARYDELKANLADATTAFHKFLDELKVAFGQKDERVIQVDSSLQSTLKRLNARTTAVVSTIVGEDRLNIIVTTANTQRAHTVSKPATEINELVAEFRHRLTDPRVDPRPAGQMLYDILVKPIEDDLKGIGADTILWSLDGTLRYIPPSALWDKDKGYLAERYSSVVLTLASRDTLGLPVSDRAAWHVLGVGVSKPTEGFTALSAVPDELDCIVTDKQNKTVAVKPKCATGVVDGLKLLDEKFTATSFENALGRYPIIHVASHFSLNPGNDKDSFLLLGGGDNKKFTVENLRNLSLADVELIVLSACNTATPGGEQANGIEIEGFGATAQKQGAKAVMASLWPVADESTRDLMVRFYTLYDKAGLTKAEGLRRAQVEMLHGKPSSTAGCTTRAEAVITGNRATYKCDPIAPYAHPYYWAPFVLFGNWR